MSVPRAAHAAVALPDGRVALIGGCVADGCEEGPGSRTVDIFDPKTNRVSQGGTLAAARISAAAVALSDGHVLIAGGWSARRPTASVELYDVVSGTSVEIGSLRTPRADIAAVNLADGRVALIGGFDGRRSVAEVDMFDPFSRRIAPGPTLSQAVAATTAVRLSDGRVLVAGGAKGAGDLLPSADVEIADSAMRGWSRVGALAIARYKHAAVALTDGRALVIGGSDDRDRKGKISVVEVFDPKDNMFTRAGTTLHPRFKIASAVALLGDGRVFIGGGAARAEIFDVRTMRSVAAGKTLGAVRSFATATPVPDGRVVVAGGYEENTIAISRGVWLVQP